MTIPFGSNYYGYAATPEGQERLKRVWSGKAVREDFASDDDWRRYLKAWDRKEDK